MDSYSQIKLARLEDDGGRSLNWYNVIVQFHYLDSHYEEEDQAEGTSAYDALGKFWAKLIQLYPGAVFLSCSVL